MKRNKEEMARIHKEKCKELKKIRAKMAENLGVDLHQRECTYEGYCGGTCPKCIQEEMTLNAAIRRKQLEEADIKRRLTAAGLTTAAAVCLSGCNVSNIEQLDGDMQYIPEETVEAMEGAIAVPETEAVEGELEPIPCTEETEEPIFVPDELEGDIAYIPTEEWELAGEVPICEEPGEAESMDETSGTTEDNDSEGTL